MVRYGFQQSRTLQYLILFNNQIGLLYNVTMIGAMSMSGIIAAMTFQGGTDTNAFYTYVTLVLVPKLWSGACVVMDNFSSHKVTGIKQAIESVGARLVYLSPYSPDFSQARKLLV